MLLMVRTLRSQTAAQAARLRASPQRRCGYDVLGANASLDDHRARDGVVRRARQRIALFEAVYLHARSHCFQMVARGGIDPPTRGTPHK
jgi:hypothetical protein